MRHWLPLARVNDEGALRQHVTVCQIESRISLSAIHHFQSSAEKIKIEPTRPLDKNWSREIHDCK